MFANATNPELPVAVRAGDIIQLRCMPGEYLVQAVNTANGSVRVQSTSTPALTYVSLQHEQRTLVSRTDAGELSEGNRGTERYDSFHLFFWCKRPSELTVLLWMRSGESLEVVRPP